MRRFLFIILALVSVSCSNNIEVDTLQEGARGVEDSQKVKITHISGQVQFTDKYTPDAFMCIPAAYTDLDGKIDGCLVMDFNNMY